MPKEQQFVVNIKKITFDIVTGLVLTRVLPLFHELVRRWISYLKNVRFMFPYSENSSFWITSHFPKIQNYTQTDNKISKILKPIFLFLKLSPIIHPNVKQILP